RQAATQRLDLAEDAFEQGRLAGAVRPDNGEQRSPPDFAGDVTHRRMAVVAERQVAKNEDGRRILHGHLNAHSTAPHSRTDATATIANRAGTDSRNIERRPGDGTEAAMVSEASA